MAVNTFDSGYIQGYSSGSWVGLSNNFTLTSSYQYQIEFYSVSSGPPYSNVVSGALKLNCSSGSGSATLSVSVSSTEHNVTDNLTSSSVSYSSGSWASFPLNAAQIAVINKAQYTSSYVGIKCASSTFQVSGAFSSYPPIIELTTSDGSIYVNVGGSWKQGIPFVNVNGSWKQGVAFINVGGSWKQGL